MRNVNCVPNTHCMTISFYVAFKSTYGQSLAIQFWSKDKNGELHATEFPLAYLNDAYWLLQLERHLLPNDALLEYNYVFRDQNTGFQKVFPKSAPIKLNKLSVEHLEIVDEWNNEKTYPDVFASLPFTGVFAHKEKVKVSSPKKPTHIIKVKAPALAMGKLVCLTGSCGKLGNWNSAAPLLLENKKSYWQIKLNLQKEQFPIEYKLGVYNTLTRQMEYETGDNRILPVPANGDTLSILHHNLNTSAHRWKGAGINIPVSALRSKKSWGVGEFTDLDWLTQFAKNSGLKMIQLLPINDTTATHTNADSYPYSAISAFALHPIYLNVKKMGQSLSVKFTTEVLESIAELNEKDTLHYQEVLAIKQKAIRQLYQADKEEFLNDFGWFEFFDIHRDWLMPYAVFCYLRDKHKTADYTAWGKYAHYNEEEIQQLASPENEDYNEIALHYYTQYHLHLQLKDAVDFAHKNGIIIKGDLPIGVGRHSCEAWMYPQLFHINMQAGAPPDAFATTGQNWGFPTYNWDTMAADGYAWWRRRMENMSIYFDAVRIDHVLGFFRIWSIPLHAIEGILGKFVPAWPLAAYHFSNAGLSFDEARYCEPFINRHLLQNYFGNDAHWVESQFLNGNRFKAEYNTQRKLDAFIKENPEYQKFQSGLNRLLSNVIAIRDEKPGNYHLRIAMHSTDSYKALSGHEQQILNRLFDDYFFQMQNSLWEEEGIKKLNALRQCTQMLICAEDLGMVPQMVAQVLDNMQMLALEVQRMPKRAGETFANLNSAPYLSVVTPSTHDMPTVREWWEQDAVIAQRFYEQQLGHYGDAPFYAEDWICREIVNQHLHSPAMWAVFLLQDILAMDADLRQQNPATERINDPANPHHYWNYRMHLFLEDLNSEAGFIVALKTMVAESGRG